MKGSQKIATAQQLETKLSDFSRHILTLPGIAPPENMMAFVDQIIDSLHRVEYVRTISRRQLSPNRVNPKSPLFDPISGAAFIKSSNREEAFWLAFLATLCGKNLRTGWRLAAELYGKDAATPWTWAKVTADPSAYVEWIDGNRTSFSGKFGNHRKYESLKPIAAGTGAAVRSYVTWIATYGTHAGMVSSATARASNNPRDAFATLYREMKAVKRFGRTGRFDYLTMIAKLGLAPIEANSTYLSDSATGPKKGARLLFDGQIDSRTTARELERRVALLESHLGVGMQVMEDAMCNWQKSPNLYIAFRG